MTGTRRFAPSYHLCHAIGCSVPVAPKYLMCFHHWVMVPKILKDAIWRTYRPGQEIDKKPSREYMEVQQAAIKAVAKAEGKK